VAGGLLLCGLAWALIPLLRPAEVGWYGAGGCSLLVGMLLLAVPVARRARARGARKAGIGLVISPVGLAMEQGALKGHLTWQEIQGATLRSQAKFSLTGVDAMPAIVLAVEGATIQITDSYDRTLGEIYGRLQKYWR
jgi:hypothetical protein